MTTGRVKVSTATARSINSSINKQEIATVKVTGNNLSRLWGHIENVAIHTHNAITTGIGQGVKALALGGEDLYYGAIGIKNWAVTDPSKVTKKTPPKPTTTVTPKATNVSTDQTSTPTIIGKPSAADNYKWNLPPHAWSLPVNPDSLHPDYVITGKTEDPLYHSRRRGRIFYAWGYVGNNLVKDAKGKWVNKDTNTEDNHNGFQFIWNPETFSQTTAVNMNVTPSSTDVLSGVTTYVDANSSVSFTVRLDRTNDFACAKSYFVQSPVDPVTGTMGPLTRTYDNVSELAKYYSVGQAENSDNDFANNMEKKIKQMLQYGTVADLDWLYTTINGPGFKDILGNESANIGYLRPTMVRLDLGPQSFVGVVSEIDVNHLAFTTDYIPIRTDVNITISLRANANMANSNATGGVSNGGLTGTHS